jgi:hypothetical protein
VVRREGLEDESVSCTAERERSGRDGGVKY